MNAKELKAIAFTMRSFGVTHLKTNEYELTVSLEQLDHKASKRQYNRKPVPVDAPAPEDDDIIQHKIEQLTSVMKLNDNDLVDALFPDHTQQDEESA